MKKKIIFSIGVMASCMAFGMLHLSSTQSIDEQCISLLNIEALTAQEEGCHYTNGYTAFTKKSGGAYDCCNVWVSKAPNTNEGHCR